MDLLTRTEAGRLLRRHPESIRRAVVSGELEEVTGADGVRLIPYESLARYAAARCVPGFFLTAAPGSDDAVDEVAGNFWPVIRATIERAMRLQQIRADARALAQAGRITDARIAQDWAALAENAEVVAPRQAGDVWRVRLPAAGLVLPLDAATLARLFGVADDAAAATPAIPQTAEGTA